MTANQKKETKNNHREKGYTLVEILIALTIFAFGILAVASMQIWGIQGNSTAIRHTQAATWAADRIEQLMTVPYAALADGNETEGDYTVSWTVSTDDPINNTATITITVQWNDRGMAKRADFDFYRANL